MSIASTVCYPLLQCQACTSLMICEDQKNDFCQNNGYNSVWCSKDKDVPNKCKEKYPDTKPTCKDKQSYNCDTKKCECLKPMFWKDNDQKCHYPVVPKVLFHPSSTIPTFASLSLPLSRKLTHEAHLRQRQEALLRQGQGQVLRLW